MFIVQCINCVDYMLHDNFKYSRRFGCTKLQLGSFLDKNPGAKIFKSHWLFADPIMLPCVQHISDERKLCLLWFIFSLTNAI